MKVISAETMREIDRITIDERGISGLDLMEAAGSGTANRVIDLLGDTRGHNVSIFCGKGNNGGDGFVVARFLSENEIAVKVFLVADVKELKGDALANYERIPKKVTIIQISPDDDLSDIAEQMRKESIIVDALLGTGITDPVKGEYERIINLINDSQAQIVSVDIPSGVEGSTGKVGNIAIKADHTCTMAVPKLGLFLQPGSEYTGEISVIDIGVPDDLVNSKDFKFEVLTDIEAKLILPKRKQVSHKGSFGKVLVIGGSTGVGGAVAMMSQAVLKAGAGLVVAASPVSIQKELAIKLFETMTEPLRENSHGTVCADSIEDLKPALSWADYVAIGPGIGVNDDVRAFMDRFLDICDLPLVIDADGIKCVTPYREKLKNRKAPVALTPHPGELAFFIGKEQSYVLDNYFNVALETAISFGITILLKTHRSVAISSDGRATINTTGNSGMATAGSGDVLTGLITGILAQGASMYDAVRLGAYLHGLSGDIAARELTEYSVVGCDLINHIPKAIMRILTGE